MNLLDHILIYDNLTKLNIILSDSNLKLQLNLKLTYTFSSPKVELTPKLT